jgi:hypothetical protein
MGTHGSIGGDGEAAGGGAGAPPRLPGGEGAGGGHQPRDPLERGQDQVG